MRGSLCFSYFHRDILIQFTNPVGLINHIIIFTYGQAKYILDCIVLYSNVLYCTLECSIVLYSAVSAYTIQYTSYKMTGNECVALLALVQVCYELFAGGLG